MRWVILLFLFQASWSQADCGATLQTIWKINQKNKTMTLVGKNSHGDQFCSPEGRAGLNARVNLLSKSKQTIFSQALYFQSRQFFDAAHHHGFTDPLEVNVQIKFPKTALLQQAAQIEIRDQEGELVGRGLW